MNPIAAQLMSRVVKREDGCWVWLGALSSGYGNIRIDGQKWYTHRLSYELFVGPIPAKHVIHHRCGNTACLNPDHLEAMLQVDHMQLLETALSDRCARGHLYDATNLGKRPWRRNGRRICLACRRLRYAERKKAAPRNA